MQRKHMLTAAVGIVLIAVGVAGGFKIHDVFFAPNRTYQGTIEQLAEPAQSGIFLTPAIRPSYGRLKRRRLLSSALRRRSMTAIFSTAASWSAKVSAPALFLIKPAILLRISTS